MARVFTDESKEFTPQKNEYKSYTNPVQQWTIDHAWYKEAVELSKDLQDLQKLDAHDHKGFDLNPWWSTRGMSDAELALEEYCSKDNPKFSQIPWTDCPECNELFIPKDDYLCFRCRNL